MSAKTIATQFVELCNQGKNFDVTRNRTGKRETLEEVGLYTVNDADKITREQFFYDGEH